MPAYSKVPAQLKSTLVAGAAPSGRSSTAQGLFGAAGTFGTIVASVATGFLAEVDVADLPGALSAIDGEQVTIEPLLGVDGALGVLAGLEVALLNGALVCQAALSLQEQLDAFPAAQPANCLAIPCQSILLRASERPLQQTKSHD